MVATSAPGFLVLWYGSTAPISRSCFRETTCPARLIRALKNRKFAAAPGKKSLPRPSDEILSHRDDRSRSGQRTFGSRSGLSVRVWL